VVPELSEDEERRILESPPRGTLAVLLVYALTFMAGWFFLFVVRFLGRGVVN
jgi:hypothetical protein